MKILLSSRCSNCRIQNQGVESQLFTACLLISSRAVKGCDYVIHAAFPFPSSHGSRHSARQRISGTYESDPGVAGLLNVMRACAQQHPKKIKRFVLVSSTVAIVSGEHSSQNPHMGARARIFFADTLNFPSSVIEAQKTSILNRAKKCVNFFYIFNELELRIYVS